VRLRRRRGAKNSVFGKKKFGFWPKTWFLACAAKNYSFYSFFNKKFKASRLPQTAHVPARAIQLGEEAPRGPVPNLHSERGDGTLSLEVATKRFTFSAI
jgi:hypothetical protein